MAAKASPSPANASAKVAPDDLRPWARVVAIDTEGSQMGGAGGRGLAAKEDIGEGELIAICPSYKFDAKEHRLTFEDVKHMMDPGGAGVQYRSHSDAEPAGLVRDVAPAALESALRKVTTVTEVEEWARAYTEAHLAQPEANNVAIEAPAPGRVDPRLTARRGIARGGPLRTCFGEKYWVDCVSCDPDVPSRTRLACLLYLIRSGIYPSLGLIANQRAVVDLERSAITTYCGAGVESAGSQDIDQLSSGWLKALGLPPLGLDYWAQACAAVGVRPRA